MISCPEFNSQMAKAWCLEIDSICKCDLIRDQNLLQTSKCITDLSKSCLGKHNPNTGLDSYKQLGEKLHELYNFLNTSSKAFLVAHKIEDLRLINDLMVQVKRCESSISISSDDELFRSYVFVEDPSIIEKIKDIKKSVSQLLHVHSKDNTKLINDKIKLFKKTSLPSLEKNPRLIPFVNEILQQMVIDLTDTAQKFSRYEGYEDAIVQILEFQKLLQTLEDKNPSDSEPPSDDDSFGIDDFLMVGSPISKEILPRNLELIPPYQKLKSAHNNLDSLGNALDSIIPLIPCADADDLKLFQECLASFEKYESSDRISDKINKCKNLIISQLISKEVRETGAFFDLAKFIQSKRKTPLSSDELSGQMIEWFAKNLVIQKTYIIRPSTHFQSTKNEEFFTLSLCNASGFIEHRDIAKNKTSLLWREINIIADKSNPLKGNVTEKPEQLKLGNTDLKEFLKSFGVPYKIASPSKTSPEKPVPPTGSPATPSLSRNSFSNQPNRSLVRRLFPD